MIDITLLGFAFFCGLCLKAVGLPPLVGYLIAGFVLNAMGIEKHTSLDTLSDLGITLLLFTIGLKLDIKSLLKPQVWASTSASMLLWIGVFSCVLWLFTLVGLPALLGVSFQTAVLIAFIFSFSSSICVIKILEEGAELKSRHGKLAIGILVMQDIIAVIFIALEAGKVPSVWAVALPLLIFLRPLIARFLQFLGHGELLVLAGVFVALGSSALFYALGISGHTGALLAGALIAGTSKAAEMSKTLLNIKDLLLIGFFLSIGFVALPDLQTIGFAFLLACLLPVKLVILFFVLILLRLRARTALLASLALTNVSEFGLIVAAIATDNGWLSEEWLVITALVLSFSFVFTSIVYKYAHHIYSQYKEPLKTLQSSRRLPEDIREQPTGAEIIVIGLGRVGLGAYSALHENIGEKVWGMDADRTKIKALKDKGLDVFAGDGEDADMWEETDLRNVSLIMLALPSVEDSQNIMFQINHSSYKGKVAGIAHYEDERDILLASGVDKVFNFYTEAGIGFAEESKALVDEGKADLKAIGL